MNCQACVENIDFVECEISIHRRGYISIKIDLVNNIATWKESKQWCNNFTRTISPQRAQEFRQFLGRSQLIQCLIMPGKEESCHEFSGQSASTDAMPAHSHHESTTQKEGPMGLFGSADHEKSSWSIGLLMSNEHISSSGKLPFPAGWKDFQFGLERICKSCFRLF